MGDIVDTIDYIDGGVMQAQQEFLKIIQKVGKLHQSAPRNMERDDGSLIRRLQKWTPYSDTIDQTSYLYTAINRTTSDVCDRTREREETEMLVQLYRHTVIAWRTRYNILPIHMELMTENDESHQRGIGESAKIPRWAQKFIIIHLNYMDRTQEDGLPLLY